MTLLLLLCFRETDCKRGRCPGATFLKKCD
jgi:hypothetical protein